MCTVALGPNTGTVFPVTIANYATQVNALFDTGAQRSCMNYDTFERLKLDELNTNRVPVVQSASGNSLHAVGTVTCGVNIGEKNFVQTFIVCRNMTRNVILGTDFTITHAAGVEWTRQGTKRLTCDGEIIMEAAEPRCQQQKMMYSTKHVTIPPRSFAVLEVDCDSELSGKFEVVPNPLFAKDHPNLHCETMTYDANAKAEKIPYMMINFSNTEHVTIPKNKVVATATEEVEVEYVEVNETYEATKFRNWIPSKQKLPPIPKTDFIVSPADVRPHRRIELKDYDISPETRQKFEDLCDRFPEVFSQNSEDIGHTNLLEMEIETGDSPPVASKAYTLPLKHRDWVKQELETLERAGVIERSISPWASPIVIVPKKSEPGEPPRRRMCVDFRKINALQPKVIKGDSKAKGAISLTPLPKIDELFAQLTGCKVFSSLDLRSGYFHISLSDDAKPKSAFVVSGLGKWEYNSCPFGLTQAPAYFQALISKVLKDLDFATGYLDDIIIYSRTEEEHLNHLEQVFAALKAAGLKLKRSKCDFFKSNLSYLGHMISSEGISPMPGKLDSIRNMKAPRNAREIKQFLGLAGYYRKFVPRFSDLSRPLTRLTRKDTPFEWSTQCEHSFQALKDALCEQPILRHPEPKLPYTLYTDASKYGWAGVLTQTHTTKVNGADVTMDHPVAYVSGLFRGSQLNWAALTKEAYAIYMSVKKYSFYLTDADVTLRSDHLPLKKFLQKNTLNAKVNNWAIELESYRIDFQFIKGKSNILADVLSRLIDIDPEVKNEPEEPGHEFGYACFEELPPVSITEINEVLSADVTIKADPDLASTPVTMDLPISLDKCRELQASDAKCLDLTQRLLQGKLDATIYVIEDGVLRRRIKQGIQETAIVLPQCLQDPVLVLAHDKAGHNGSKRTYEAVRKLYYWKGMRKDITRHCKNCPVCAKHNIVGVQFDKQHFRPPRQPMQFISMDLIGQLPLSSEGYQYALTVICMLTGYTFCIPLKTKTAEEVVRAYVTHVYAVFGPSQKILSDNGTEFKNKLFDQVAKQLGVDYKIYSPPFRPQSNGRIEGFHRFLKACIGKHIAKRSEWPRVAPLATAAYNFFPNEQTKESAFFLMFGRDPLIPLANLIEPQTRYLGTEECLLDMETLQNVYQFTATQLAKARAKTPGKQMNHEHKIQKGDLVYIRDHTSKAFQPKYKTDHRVVRFLGKNQLEVKDNHGNLHQVHITDVKRVHMADKVIGQIPDYSTFGRAEKIRLDPAKIEDLDWKLSDELNTKPIEDQAEVQPIVEEINTAPPEKNTATVAKQVAAVKLALKAVLKVISVYKTLKVPIPSRTKRIVTSVLNQQHQQQ